jgi:hypothetical protein
MKFNIPLLFILLLLFTQCNNSQHTLIGTWQPTQLSNPNMEALIARELADSDTTGNNDPVLKQAINADSFKQLRQQLLMAEVAEQQEQFKGLQFSFLPNNRVYITGPQTNDSAMWQLQKNELVIDGPALTGVGDKMIFTVIHLEADSMVLLNINAKDSAYTTFKKMK